MKLAKLKKTLAVMLSAAMVFSAVPVTAMADVVESEAIEVSGAEETVESEDAATEEVDAEIEESDESQDVEVSGVEEETEAVEELDAVEEDVEGDGETVAEGTYDFTDKNAAYYKKAAADISIPGLALGLTGTDNATGHGVHAKENDTITFNLESAATITLNNCGYSAAADHYFTAEGLTPTEKAYTIEGDGSNGKSTTFNVAAGGEFVVKVAASQLYLHSIDITYIEETVAAGTYDFTDKDAAYYKKAAADISIPGLALGLTGTDNATGHGVHAKENDTITFSLESAATITLNNCG